MADTRTLVWSLLFVCLEWIYFTKAQLFQGPVPPGSFLYHVGSRICYVTTEDVTSPGTPLDGKCIVYNIEGSTVLGVRRYGDSVFLGDSGNSELERRYLDENSQFIVSYGAHGVNGLTVDWSANVVYWTETDDGTILAARTDVDEQYITEVLSNRDRPTGLAVDPRNRSLYWGEGGSGGKIYRSFTDGTSWEVFLEAGVGRPGDLAADQPDNRLYWVDMDQNSIKSVKLDGTDLQTVKQGSPGYTIKGITISQYLLSWGQVRSGPGTGQDQGVYWANKTDGSVIRQLTTTESISDVVYFGRYPQHDTAHGLCTTDNGGCAHICLHTQYHRPACRCSFGYSSTDGGKSCTASPLTDRTFLLVSDLGWWSAFQVPLGPPARAIRLPLGQAEKPIGVQYDTDRGLVYWVDRQTNTIRRSQLDGSEKQNVYVMPEDAAPESLALDTWQQKLYVTDPGRDVIFSVTSDGGRYTNVTNTGLDQPRDLILDTKSGYMYWTDWGDRPKIERARLDTGEQRLLLVTGLVKPNGLAADFQKGSLYWTDSDLDRVETSALDGSGRREIAQIPGSQFYGLAVSGSHLYVADQSSRHLKRIDLETNVVEDWGPGLFQGAFQVKVVTISSPTPPTTPNPDPESIPFMVIAIAVSVGGVVVIATIVIVIFMYRRRRLKQNSTPPVIENPGYSISTTGAPGGRPAGSVASRDSTTPHQPVPYRDLYGKKWEGGNSTKASSKAGSKASSKHGKSKKASKKKAPTQGGFTQLDETSSVGSGSVASRHTSVSMVTDGKPENTYEELPDDMSTTGSVASRVSNTTDISFTSTTALFNNRR